MTYADPVDFREKTQKAWASNLILSEVDIGDTLLTALIAEVARQIEIELDDDFDPPAPDNDETIDVYASGGNRLYMPRRTRAVTTVQTRNTSGALTTEASTAYRLHSSLNAAGTAMIGRERKDWLDMQTGLSTGAWPQGAGTVRVTGKFGWAAVPDDIKRLVGLYVYDMAKATTDPLSRVLQRSTGDAVLTFGPPEEIERIKALYNRRTVLVV